jgi:hypothetical protein
LRATVTPPAGQDILLREFVGRMCASERRRLLFRPSGDADAVRRGYTCTVDAHKRVLLLLLLLLLLLMMMTRPRAFRHVFHHMTRNSPSSSNIPGILRIIAKIQYYFTNLARAH